jgi:hypothetical protein
VPDGNYNIHAEIDTGSYLGVIGAEKKYQRKGKDLQNK